MCVYLLNTCSHQILCFFRPSEPASSVLDMHYNQFVAKTARDRPIPQSAGPKQREKLSYGITRATLLRQKVPAPPPAPLWQMPRFAKIGPTVRSFRTDEMRMISLTTNINARAAVIGTAGQGILRTAGEC